ncbi:hypothetical protein, partial [Vibrio lentus]
IHVIRYVNGEKMKFPEGVYLFHTESLKDQYFDEFVADLNVHGIKASVHSRREPGLYACNEWLIPTSIVAGVSAGFLNEAGKDLYQVAKSKLAELCTATIKKPRIEPVLIGSEGKINNNNPFSSGFSIYSETNMGCTFKLLIPKYSAQIDYNKIVHAYLDFLKDYNDGIVSKIDIGLDLSTILPSSTILVHYNESTKSIEWLDHLPAHVREGMRTV